MLNVFCDVVFQLLEDEQFIAVDKIKTVGNVYMFAVGLKPQCIIDVSDVRIPNKHCFCCFRCLRYEMIIMLSAHPCVDLVF